ncbi:sugar phosphate isomerase/epimerase family protein [Marinomonas sp. IMCC 4694]|uniref:sugar phosphate isomerase/epimerase family protein n=1 Tax=Marinomonas sp. IMCC 4694 TaxID=2605432 RepID=UPI0011E892F5|nr:sugar phosphate isomerase/epimerase family protein [Marinomonas sp. IMCC 4694]TYL48834.1 sugar phosphate isomerase/epimerase [Marinomonas sp. IMCC 4694]
MAYSFSLAFLTLFDVAPSRAVEIAAQAGFSHVGLRLLPSATEGLYPLMTDDKELRDTQAAMQDTGVQLADIEIVRIGEGFRVEETVRFLERGARLGAKNVLVAGDDDNEARLIENYALFCDMAGRFGMTADLEFMPWTKVPNIASALRVVEGANQSNGGVLIDALHYHRAGMTPLDVKTIDPKWLHYVQFCDAMANFDPSTEGLIHIARQARLNPGDGEIDLVSLLQAIPDGSVLSLEVPNFDYAKQQSPIERACNAMAGMKQVISAAKAHTDVPTGASM